MFLPEKLSELIKDQADAHVTQSETDSRHIRYSKSTKQLATLMHFKSPAAYTELKNVMYLPTQRRLQDFVKDIPQTIGT